MRDAFVSALKLMIAVFGLALIIAFIDLRWLEPMRQPPCDPDKIEKGHVCLHTVLEKWGDKIIWIDARSQDDNERHPFTHPQSYKIRPNDQDALGMIIEAMPALIGAEENGQCIVIFCSKSCSSATDVATELR